MRISWPESIGPRRRCAGLPPGARRADADSTSNASPASTVEECAEVLETSPRTVKRDWQKARAFLYQEIIAPGSC